MTSRTRLVRVRRVVQAAFLLLFLYLATATRHPLTPLLPVDSFLRMDPLAQLGAALAARDFVPYLLWAAPLLVATLLLGRFFCGWVCPMGTTLDLFRLRRFNPPPGKNEMGFRRFKYLLLAAALVAALAGSLVLMPLDPITLLTRTFALYLYPALNAAVTGALFALYERGILPDLMVWIDTDLRGSLLPAAQPYFRLSWLFLLLFASIVALNLVAHRFWCRYLCPLGAMLGLASRWSLLGRHSRAGCVGCGKCVARCRMGTIGAKGYANDGGECILCGDCATVCPDRAISYGGRPSSGRYDPSRRQLLGVAGVAALGIAGLRADAPRKGTDAFDIRPPGAQGAHFLDRCVRCGQCMKVCPSSGLQPSLLQAGLEGLWTPLLVARLGPCQYDCTACGEVCPTGAIQRLELESKRQAIIGTAYVDQRRCIPWVDGGDCIVCQELCPVSPKAIALEDTEATGDDGTTVEVRRPRVIRDRCIGCGICEHHCPVPGEAAIRVYGIGTPTA